MSVTVLGFVVAGLAPVYSQPFSRWLGGRQVDLLVVPDSVAFYHPDAAADTLRKDVEGLVPAGWEFTNHGVWSLFTLPNASSTPQLDTPAVAKTLGLLRQLEVRVGDAYWVSPVFAGAAR